MSFNSDIVNKLKIIGDFLEADIINELLAGGKFASGDLVESIETRVKDGLSLITLEGLMAEHGRYVVTGRKSGGKKVPLDALIDWIKVRGFATGAVETRGIAFAIQNKIFDEGIKPFNFIDNVFNKQQGRIDAEVVDIVNDAFEASFDNLITETQKQINRG